MPLKKEFKPPNYNMEDEKCQRKIFKGRLYKSCFFVGWGSKDIIKKKKKKEVFASFSNFHSEYAFLRYEKLFSLTNVTTNFSIDSQKLYIKFDMKRKYLTIIDRLET